MCEVFEVSRSGYYDWIERPMSQQEKRKEKLIDMIREIFIKSRRLYGSPKITAILRKSGCTISQKTVSRLMSEYGLVSRTVKKYKATTNSKHNYSVKENILNQEFSASSPNESWMVDITYIPTNEGWAYLSSVMDLYSRKIVGWHLDNRMTTDLVLTALNRAVYNQNPSGNVLHHSDRGSQYASNSYQQKLKELKMVSSMSRKGNCYDNACIESFHSIIKKELVYLTKFNTRLEAKKSIFEYIEVFYNRQRIHSSIHYMTPVEFEKLYYKGSSETAA